MLCAFAPSLFASGTKSPVAAGLDHYLTGNYEIALGEFRDAVKRHPRSSEAHEYLGRTLLKLRHWTEAVGRLITAYGLLPEHRKDRFWASIWNDIAAALGGLLESGQWDEAVVALSELWQLNMASPDSQAQLAALFTEHAVKLLAEGRFEEALTAFAQGSGVRNGDLQAL
jgi:tetratricopeptide (TPR) repeat protein